MARTVPKSPDDAGRPIDPLPGGSVDPIDVVGRDGQAADALTLLRNGNNLLINDPRRMGKTGFLARLGHTATDLDVVHVDYESVVSTDEFMTVRRLAGGSAPFERGRRVFGSIFDALEIGVGLMKVKAEFSHRRPDDLLVETLERFDDSLDDSVLLVVAMDELTAGILSVIEHEGADAGHILLAALRTVRQRRPTHLRWVLTGSVGFHHVLRGAGQTAGAVGDVAAFELGPLEIAGGSELADRLLRGIGGAPDPAAIEALVKTTGGIPYLLHQIAHRLRGSTSVDPETVDAAWQGGSSTTPMPVVRCCICSTACRSTTSIVSSRWRAHSSTYSPSLTHRLTEDCSRRTSVAGTAVWSLLCSTCWRTTTTSGSNEVRTRGYPVLRGIWRYRRAL